MTNQTNPYDFSTMSNVISLPIGAEVARQAADSYAEAEQPDGMPSNFSLTEEGVFQFRSDGDEDLLPVQICSPMIVEGIWRSASGACWGRVVSVQDPDGVWHELIFEEKHVSKGANVVLDSLLENGLTLTSADKAAKSVLELLAAWRPKKRYLRADRLGWTDGSFNAFVMGNSRVIGETPVVVSGVSTDIETAIHEKGALDGWREEVSALCEGNPLMTLAVSHAFSGPILELLGKDGGGFHLRGASSCGKSTLLRVAASVWGAPSFVQSWRATDNGIEGVAAACNGTVLILDELYQVDPRKAGDMVYMLGNGVGKGRMASNGKSQAKLSWKVSILSSGEISLEEHLASGNRKIHAGQDVRLIDLAADARTYGAFDRIHGESDGQAFSDRLQKASRNCYGVAGPAFVAKLMTMVERRDVMFRNLESFNRRCRSAADIPSDGQVQRVMMRFGIAALAGELATLFGLTGWEKGHATAAAQELFLDWFDARDGATKTDILEVLGRVKNFWVREADGFQSLGTTTRSPRYGWKDDAWLYVSPDAWRLMHPGLDPVEPAKLLKAVGLLKTQKGGSLQFKMGRGVVDRPRVYAVRLSEIEAVAAE